MPDNAFEELRRHERDAHKLLRELGLALEQALIGFQEPSRAASPFRARLQRLQSQLKLLATTAPNLAQVATALSRSVEKEFEGLVRRATTASQRRGRVDGRIQLQYNQVVGGALAQAPGQATRALDGQIRRGVGELVNRLIPPDQVPGDVRSLMTRELSQWLVQQPLVDDAFFVLQSVLTDVSGFLHARLTIHRQLEALRDDTAGQQQLTPDQARARDAQVGQLAERSVELDREIERRIRSRSTSVQGVFKLDPKLVLDPTKRFLERLDAQAGIQIRQGDVKVELGTRIRITDPLTGVSGVGVNPYLGVQVNPNLNINASYQNEHRQGNWQGGQFKVSLSWRF